jgi:hypothetical protein
MFDLFNFKNGVIKYGTFLLVTLVSPKGTQFEQEPRERDYHIIPLLLICKTSQK